MAYKFSMQVPVRWKDVDGFNVINNAVYLTMAEEARFGYFAHLELLKNGIDFPFVLGEIACRFERSGRAGMLLDLQTRVTRLGHKSFDMEYEVGHDSEVLATLFSTQVWVVDGMKSGPIADSARQRIAEFEGIPAGPTEH